MSEESYKLCTLDDIDRYKNKSWFKSEAKSVLTLDGAGWLIPIKYINLAKDKLQEILDNFDFKRVETMMLSAHWTWAPLGRVPNIEDMKNLVIDLFNRHIQSKIESNLDAYVSTGGFTLKYDSINKELSLTFEGENCVVYYDD